MWIIVCAAIVVAVVQSCNVSPSSQGGDNAQEMVQSTINDSIQGIVERELGKMCQDAEPLWATAVVMDVATGDIKAMASLERKDSADVSKGYVADRNFALMDFEPGSTMDVISMLVALEDSVVADADERITTGGSWACAGGVPIKDTHAYPDLNLTEIIARSSNIGIAKIITSGYGENPSAFGERLASIGLFGDLNANGLVGVQQPRIAGFEGNENFNVISLSRMSYGYGIAMTPLHTLAVYNAIANGGQYVQPRLETNGKVGSVKTVCSKGNALKLCGMMHAVVHDQYGTGRSLRSSDVDLAGKTGVAYMTENGRYTDDKRYTFCGFFPYGNPRYSCIVVCERGKQGAASTCGKVFAGIAREL